VVGVLADWQLASATSSAAENRGLSIAQS
jgi:hypothetical protein